MKIYILLPVLLAGASAQTTITTFTLPEPFSVSSPDQPIKFRYSGPWHNPSTTRMLGPNGLEVPYQQLSDGSILIRSRLAASLLSVEYRVSAVRTSTQSPANTLVTESGLSVGDAVTVYASTTLPGGILANKTYYIASRVSSDLTLSTSPTLSPVVTITSAGSGTITLRKLGFVAEAGSELLYARGHAYQTGDPVTVRSYGALPGPLVAETTYYVIAVDADTFKLATTHAAAQAGQGIRLDTAGTGPHETVVNWSWTLQGDASPKVTTPNPVTVLAAGDHFELTNGLTGVRIPRTNPSLNLAPIQAVRTVDGRWLGPQSGVNRLYNYSPGSPISTMFNAGASWRVVFLEQGSLMTQVSLEYVTKRPAAQSPHATTISSVDAAADTITFTGTNYAYSMNYLPNRSVRFLANGGTLPAPLVANTTYYLLATASSSVFQVAATAGGLPIDLTSDKTGSPSAVPYLDSGSGYAHTVITLYSDERGILVADEGDTEFAYFLNVANDTFRPNLGRYRSWGNNSSTATPDCGHFRDSSGLLYTVTSATNATPIIVSTTSTVTGIHGARITIAGVQGNTAANGTFYVKTNGLPLGQMQLYSDAALTAAVAGNGNYLSGGVVKIKHDRQGVDAFREYEYTTATYNQSQSGGCNITGTSRSLPRLLTFYPPNYQDAGFYELIYENIGDAASPVIGIFNGPQSANYNPFTAGPGFTGGPTYIGNGGLPGFGILNVLGRRGSDGKYTNRMARSWGLYSATQAELRSPWTYQDIAIRMNALTGINLTKMAEYQLTFPDPEGGWKWQYMSDEAGNALVNRIRTDSTFRTKVSNASSSASSQSLLSMWTANTAAATRIAMRGADQLSRSFRSGQVWGDGVYHRSPTNGTGLPISNNAAVVYSVLMDANATSSIKERAKSHLSFWASLLWDNDNIPRDTNPSESFGTYNQNLQFTQYRSQVATQLCSHPAMVDKLPKARSYDQSAIDAVNDAGAPRTSTHYDLTYQPGIFNLLNRQTSGQFNFAEYSRFINYGWWQAHIMTPPDPRFANSRRTLPLGDGSPEPNDRLAVLATALKHQPEARKWMWLWNRSGSSSAFAMNDFYIPEFLAIDTTIPEADPTLTSTDFDGYMSTLRFNWNTGNETAAWLAKGNWYFDHGHVDYGALSLFAHSAPLLVEWGATDFYNPHVKGGMYHNVAVMTSDLSKPWTSDNFSLAEGGARWGSSTSSTFAAFSRSAVASASHGGNRPTWTRRVLQLNHNRSYPAIYVTDDFGGSTAARLVNYIMAASGTVTTPTGIITPIVRTSTSLASSGTVGDLSPGIQRFTFTGSTYASHASGGIKWDLYVIPDGSTQQFQIGNWSDGVTPAHILRLHDSGSTNKFRVLILPYRKGESPTRTVTEQSCGIQIEQAGTSSCFDDSHSSYDDGTGTQVIATYDTAPFTAFGITISGGPTECVKAATAITCTVSGSAGRRTITLPSGWYPLQPTAYDSTGNIQAEPGDKVLTLTFTSIPSTLRTLRIPAPVGCTKAKLRLALALDSSTPDLLGVNPGSLLTIKASPGAYQAQWISDSGEGKVFTITVK